MPTYPHQYTFPVAYADVDIGSNVYHTRYIEWCERARYDLFRKHDIDLYQLGKTGSHFVVARINARYIQPGYLGDQLDIHTKVATLKHVSAVFKQVIFKGDTKLFDADFTVACVGNDFQPKRIPGNVHQLLERLQD